MHLEWVPLWHSPKIFEHSLNSRFLIPGQKCAQTSKANLTVLSTAGSSTKAGNGFSGDDCWTGDVVRVLLCSSAATRGMPLGIWRHPQPRCSYSGAVEKDWRKGLKGRESFQLALSNSLGWRNFVAGTPSALDIARSGVGDRKSPSGRQGRTWSSGNGKRSAPQIPRIVCHMMPMMPMGPMGAR